MLYTEDFSMRRYVGFSQIGSHIHIHIWTHKSQLKSCHVPKQIYMHMSPHSNDS